MRKSPSICAVYQYGDPLSTAQNRKDKRWEIFVVLILITVVTTWTRFLGEEKS
jgi:hypothetical protein